MAKQATSQQVDLKLSSYGGQPTITAISSITLQNGFVIPTGSSVRLYISNTVNVGSLPSTTQNYILTRKFKKEGVNLINIDNERSIFEENQTISYFDGLGRLSQKIDLKASPAYRDLVNYKEYDEYGRESKLYEPYADNLTNDGSFKTNVKQQQLDFYSATTGWDDYTPKTIKPFSVISFDLSAFGRTLEQGAVGEHWQPFSSGIVNSGHTVKKSYENNIENEVKFWFPSVGGADGTEYYLRGRLKKNIIKDENWITGKQGTIEDFIDDNGQTVLKRIWETETKKLDTYYVYDDFGALSYVIPPGFTGNTIDENTTDFFELIYAYRYDDKRRLVEKKMPGKGWEYLIYNRGDRVILTQDANQRSAKKWSYIKYDAFGKVVSSGIYTNSIINQTTRVQVQALADAVSVQYESRNGATTYTNASFPSTLSQLQELIVNYYDDYKFKPVTTLAAGNGIDSTYLVKGLLTGIKVSREDGSYPLMSVNYYDRYGRIVEIVADNNLSGVDRTANTYDFTGKLLTSNRQHSINGTNLVTKILTTNNYDHVDRLVQIKKKINEQDEIIQSRLAYNEIGQLKTKSLHSENGGGNFMTNIDYAYNERGWQTKASSAQFTSQLNYNVNGTTVLGNAQYNGNIAQQLWGYAATTNSTFTYSYDALNRLMSGVSTGTVMSEVLTYDDMGNIKTLVRDNGTAINYNYNNVNKSNRLAGLTGGVTGSFTYDLNGNATKDRTGMTLSYNYLNLPKTVTGTGKSIAYTYDASGAKLNRKSTVGGITTEQDYIGGIEYSKASGANPVIERIATEDGFLLNSSGNYSYYYNLTDHLGNVRVVLKKDGTATAPVATVMQKQDYYPFGKTKSIATSINNKYLYNGKEMQTDLNGGMHILGGSYVLEGQLDYGSRFYDAEIGRFNVIDRFAEKYSLLSPYQYGANNPILNIDVNGDSIWTTTRTEVINGVTYNYYTTHISGKVLNQANAYSISDFISGLNSKLNSQTSSMTFSDGSVNVYNIQANFTAAKSIEDVKEGDHLLTIVNKVLGKGDPALGGGPALGIAKLKGKNSFIQYGQGVQMAFHELGHNFGFNHPEDDEPDYSTNPMGYAPGNLNFSRDQLIKIYDRARKPGLLNQGVNRQYIINKVPGYNDRSTNERPYKGQRTFKMMIPTIIINPNK